MAAATEKIKRRLKNCNLLNQARPIISGFYIGRIKDIVVYNCSIKSYTIVDCFNCAVLPLTILFLICRINLLSDEIDRKRGSDYERFTFA